MPSENVGAALCGGPYMAATEGRHYIFYRYPGRGEGVKMRTPVIAGNWKMNNTIAESLELVRALHYGHRWPGEVEVVVAPPFTAIHDVAKFLKDSYIGIAAQNIFWEDVGAFTGEISGAFIKEAGAGYAIIGHSERRQYFGETNETVNKKIHAALRNRLIPIVCVGETLEERESGQIEKIIEQQISIGLNGLTENELNDIIIAYEPVWAIGTGKTATPDQAEEVHSMIRQFISEKFSNTSADSVRIIYGGSAKPSNSKELLSQNNIDGLLVGGASLKAADFIEIVKSIY